MIKGYDKWKLSSGEREIIVGECQQCGGELYLNEEYYKTNEGKVHLDCYEQFAEEILDAEIVEGFDGLVR